MFSFKIKKVVLVNIYNNTNINLNNTWSRATCTWWLRDYGISPCELNSSYITASYSISFTFATAAPRFIYLSTSLWKPKSLRNKKGRDDWCNDGSWMALWSSTARWPDCCSVLLFRKIMQPDWRDSPLGSRNWIISA